MHIATEQLDSEHELRQVQFTQKMLVFRSFSYELIIFLASYDVDQTIYASSYLDDAIVTHFDI